MITFTFGDTFSIYIQKILLINSYYTSYSHLKQVPDICIQDEHLSSHFVQNLSSPFI